MNTIRVFLWAAFLMANVCHARTAARPRPAVPGATAADAQVKALYEAEWVWRAKEFGKPDDDQTARAGYLPHVDPLSQQKHLEYWSQKLSALNAIPDEQIVTEKINAAVFRTVLEAFVAQQKFRDYEAPFTSGGSFWGSLAPRGGFGSVGSIALTSAGCAISRATSMNRSQTCRRG
jgi:hypothetical protein